MGRRPNPRVKERPTTRPEDPTISTPPRAPDSSRRHATRCVPALRDLLRRPVHHDPQLTFRAESDPRYLITWCPLNWLICRFVLNCREWAGSSFPWSPWFRHCRAAGRRLRHGIRFGLTRPTCGGSR